MNDACQILISTNLFKMQLNIKFHAIPSVNFCTSVATKFVSHTDRQAFFKNSEVLIRTSQIINRLRTISRIFFVVAVINIEFIFSQKSIFTQFVYFFIVLNLLTNFAEFSCVSWKTSTNCFSVFHIAISAIDTNSTRT